MGDAEAADAPPRPPAPRPPAPRPPAPRLPPTEDEAAEERPAAEHAEAGREGEQDGEEDGEDEQVQVRTVGGAFVVGEPRAVSFEELLCVAHLRPSLDSVVNDVGQDEAADLSHPLESHAPPRDAKRGSASSGGDGGVGVPISRGEWYRTDGSAFRLSGSSAGEHNRRHMVYDVFFSGKSIGLTLSFKDHIYVQALTGAAAQSLGLIAKGDIILSATCERGWVRCSGSLSDLTTFIRENGRPMMLRFWRRPESIQLGAVLKSSTALDTFLTFLHAYLDSPNYREVLRSERALAEQLENDRARTGRRAARDDSDGEASPRQGKASTAPSNGGGSGGGGGEGASAGQRYLNTPIAQVMFLVEVLKVRQQAKAAAVQGQAQGKLAQYAVQVAVKENVAEKYLRGRSSEFSIRELCKRHPHVERARKEVLESNSLAALDELGDFVSELVRNDTFALFLHSRDAELALQKLGEKGAWKLRVFSQMARSFVPLEQALNDRKCACALLLHMLSVTDKKARERCDKALRYLVLWNVHRFGGSGAHIFANMAGLLANKADLVRMPEGVEVDEENLLPLLVAASGPVYREFVTSPLGALVAEARNKAAHPSNGGDESRMDAFMPRLSALLHAAKLPDNLTRHRAVQEHPGAAAAGAEADGDNATAWEVQHAVVFASRPDAEHPVVLGAAGGGGGSMPAQLEHFFVPHGLDTPIGAEFADPLIFNFMMGDKLYGCSLVCLVDSQHEGRQYVGLCAITGQRKVRAVREFVEAFYRKNAQALCAAAEEGADVAALVQQLELAVASTTGEQPTESGEGEIGDGNGGSDDDGSDSEQGAESAVGGALGFAAPHRPRPLRKLDFDMGLLFEVFSIGTIMSIFESCLLERKILLVSKRYSALTIACETLRELLTPLQWCHVYAPVLPRTMLAHLECPTPFLVGINTHFAFKKDFPFLLDAVIVDLDHGTIQMPAFSARGSDPTRSADSSSRVPPNARLPVALREDLLQRMHAFAKPRFEHSDSLGAAEPESCASAAMRLRCAFRDVVQSLLGTVHMFCAPVHYEGPPAADSIMLFDEDAFLDSVDVSDWPFYKAFLRTQAFSSFTSSFL